MDMVSWLIGYEEGLSSGGSAGVANILWAEGSVEILEDGSGKITHNLGVVPDIICAYAVHFGAITVENYAPMIIHVGFSRAFAEAVGTKSKGHYVLVNLAVTPPAVSSIGAFDYIDNTGATNYVHDANTMTALLGQAATGYDGVINNLGLTWGATGGFKFIAIGGLTPSGSE